MKLIDAIFCDDIRKELNNKLSLMGFYSDKMILNIDRENKLNGLNQSIYLYCCDYRSMKMTNNQILLVFQYFLNKKNILKINNPINIGDNNKSLFQLILNGASIPLEPGNLGFSIKLFYQQEILLSEKNDTALIISTSG